MCHYSLNWAKDEKPDRHEMLRAEGSLKALGMERHQALIVSHRDGQPHVHVIANRVEPESGKAAGLNRSKLKLSKWAERYEREIESKAGGVYRSWMEGAEERAREAARRDGLSVYYHYRGEDWDRLKRSASEERMEQVQEFDGEQAYEKMMRAMEEARQEKARQAERARASGEGKAGSFRR